jgi:hypothetical protein
MVIGAKKASIYSVKVIMIESFVAFTDEIDDPKAAATEISAQIEGGITLRKNTVGLVHCHTEFLDTESYAAICGALSFPIFGFTTSINGGGPAMGTELGAGEFYLTLMVLTSDDISFEISVSEKIKIGDDYEKAIAPALLCTDKAGSSDNVESSDKAKKPALVMVCAPSIETIPGDDLVKVFDKCLPGVPLFGGFSVDDSPRYNESVFALEGGNAHPDRVIFLKIFGDVKPLFFSASLSKDKVNPRGAVVTKSNGTEIIELNNRPVTEYMHSIGLSESVLERGVVTNFALIIDNPDNDGYYARAMLRLTPEKTLVCGGDVPEGAIIHIGEFEKGDTISAGRTAATRAVAVKANALLAVSSISRSTILGSDIFHGIDTVRKLTGDLPFIMGYAAGEFCPDTSGETPKNRFNNQSFNACAL